MSNLSERIAAFRTDRPDEWSMDEFKRDAEALEQRTKELEQELDYEREERQKVETALINLSESSPKFALEQQAKGVEDFLLDCYPEEPVETWQILERVLELRQKAEEL